MAQDPENIVLEHLRAIRADTGEIKTDVVEIKERLGLIESQYGNLSRRVDRLGGDFEQIKRRRNLIDA
jgi:phage shock protein A